MHSGYDFDTQISFCTLAIGDSYIEKSMTLVQSVLKFTSSEIYVITDTPEKIEGHKSYYGPRVKILDIKDYTYYTAFVGDMFNYNLKGIALWMMARETQNTIVYVDADTFLFGWDKGTSRFIIGHENSLFCRFRERVSDNTSLKMFIPQKAAAHGIDYTQIHTHLAIETIMILTRGADTNNFLGIWKDLIDYATINKIDPFIEAFELAVAMDRSDIKPINITRFMPFADSFRTIHNGRLITTNII